jgi:K+-sensing histidine kinase KdpD
MAVVGVHSDGSNIDPARLPSLFDSFHLEKQPEEATDGLALGLYLAKRIVVGHGGKVEAQSSNATGTTLEATLPLA